MRKTKKDDFGARPVKVNSENKTPAKKECPRGPQSKAQYFFGGSKAPGPPPPPVVHSCPHAVVWAPTGDAAFHRACWAQGGPGAGRGPPPPGVDSAGCRFGGAPLAGRGRWFRSLTGLAEGPERPPTMGYKVPPSPPKCHPLGSGVGVEYQASREGLEPPEQKKYLMQSPAKNFLL